MTDAAPDTQSRSLGIFANRDAAETARSRLMKEGFTPAAVQIVQQGQEASLPAKRTKAAKSARGAAIAFGLLGGTIGLLLSLGARELFTIPVSMPPFPLPPILAIAAGAFIGTLAGGLIGASTGLNIPQTDAIDRRDYVTGEYRLDLHDSSEEEVRHARLILQRMDQANPQQT
ncbi:MAG: hypothetical protein ACFB8W_12110 [Elainellaceae cyanobacterium]